MIALLSGIVAGLGDDHAIIDVNGVGYKVFAAPQTLAKLPVGEATRLFIETHVREDHIHLFGFQAATERDWFVLLQTVQGVGAKVALAMLGTVGVEDITQAILLGDKAIVGRANGVGPKLAQRIVTELKDKLPANLTVMAGASDAASALNADGPAIGSDRSDAVSALVNLGYKEPDAQRAVAKVLAEHGGDTALNDMIRLGLKELAA